MKKVVLDIEFYCQAVMDEDSVNDMAKQAGVSRTTILNHWPEDLRFMLPSKRGFVEFEYKYGQMINFLRANGYSVEKIADAVFLSPKRIRTYLRNLKKRFGTELGLNVHARKKINRIAAKNMHSPGRIANELGLCRNMIKDYLDSKSCK